MAKAPNNSNGNNSPVMNAVVDDGKEQVVEEERQKDNSSGSEEGTLSSESNTVASASQVVDNSNTHAVRWDQMFVRLQEFKRKHGHCRVPNRYKPDPSLGSWVSAQRRQYKIVTSGQSGSTAMTMERAKKLVDLGFEWSTSNPNHVSWETRYEELQAFVKAHGHAQVPMRWQENEQLSNWVSKQRQDYKLLRSGQSSRLSEERLKLLRDIGFVWEVDRATSRQLKGAVLKSNPEPSLPMTFPVSVGDGGGGNLTAVSGSTGPASDLSGLPTEPTPSSTDSTGHGANGVNASSNGSIPEESQDTARAERTEDAPVADQTGGTDTVPATAEDIAQQSQSKPVNFETQEDTKQPAACDVTALPSSAKLEDSDVTSPEEKAVPEAAELCPEESPATDSAVKQGVASPSRKGSRKTVSRSTGSSEPQRRSKRRKGNG